jgi:putative inorganic carbon (HCO3(-)) transporter
MQRLVVQFVSLSLLIWLFLKRFEFESIRISRIPGVFLFLLSLLFVAFILSAVFSSYPINAFEPGFRLIAFFIIVYLYYTQIKDLNSVKIIIFTLFGVSFIIATAVIYDFVSYGISMVNLLTVSYRASGLINNYNATSGFFAVTIPLTISLMFYKSKRDYRFILTLFLILQFVGLFFTGSRSAYLAIFVSLIVILFNVNRRIFYNIFKFSLLTVIILLLYEPFSELLSGLFRLERGLTFRDTLWSISLSMISDNPFFGVGPGAYGNLVFNHFPLAINSYEGRLLIDLFDITQGRNASHNFYLMLFSDLGILGFVFAISFPVVILRLLKKIIDKLKSDKNINYYIILGITGALAGMFVRGIFEGLNLMTYGWIYVDLPVWLLISISFFYYNKLVKSKSGSLIAS